MVKYLITGATGYVGSMLVKFLKSNQEDAHISIIARDKDKAFGMFGKAVDYYIDDINNSSVSSIEGEFDYIIHCASETKSMNMVTYPVETANTIINGTQNMLQLARKTKAKKMIFLSSMEVYGNIECPEGKRVSEDELGYLDIKAARSCYPMAKRMAESLCFYYNKEYNVPVVVARLAQTFGKGILASESRVFAQFAKAVVAHEDIVLNTDGSSVGNYCDIEDVISALLVLLEKGTVGDVYNIVNEDNTMSIKEMAELVVENFASGKSKVLFNNSNQNFGYAAKTGLRLSGKKISELGWKPKKNLVTMYEELIADLDKG